MKLGMPYSTIFFGSLLFVLGLGCGCSKSSDRNATSTGWSANANSGTGQWMYLEKGDLPILHTHGKLRILTPQQFSADRLPRADFPLDHEQDLMTEFCRSLGLEPVFVFAQSHDQLIPWLLEGKGDVIMASLTMISQCVFGPVPNGTKITASSICYDDKFP